jgi:DNA polymerase
MDPRRLQYLQAIGLPVWVRRRPATPPADPEGVAVAIAPVPAAADPGSSGAVAGSGWSDAAAPAELDWDSLQRRVAECRACELWQTRTQTVFGVGNRQAEWMVVGEAPGADEDRLGEPFVGRAGQLLDAMLHAVGLAREQVYIANVLKCRPPRNRDPRPEEAAACDGYLARQIGLVRPRLILAVGRIAAQHLLGTDLTLSRLRGRRHRHPGTDLPLVVTYHPAYLLRSPADKRKAWEDLRLACQIAGRPP